MLPYAQALSKLAPPHPAELGFLAPQAGADASSSGLPCCVSRPRMQTLSKL